MSNQEEPLKLKLGIVGSPLNHTKSPQIQSAGLRFLGIDGDYSKYEITKDDFANEFPKILPKIDGLNVTIPYKESTLNYLNKIDPLVARIGAANTIKFHDGLIEGYNTDYYGFIRTLESLDLEDKVVAVLGAGGAAKAIIIALEDLNVREIDIYVRNKNKVINSLPDIKVEHQIKNMDEIDLTEASLVVNCTPIGQGRLSDHMPLEIDALEKMPPGSLVYDLIYSDTLLLKEARELGYQTMNGRDMLIYQGVESLRIWTGEQVTEGLVEAMRESL